ncbi:hypothetical protein [Leptolyngbya ohadii]|uniref:hypothetical protein n=1 Tax=Leptolyngbya ohadii TaxID=1962290 RepID=UPI000B59BA9D|nr:hypothetical protein [Leptolyngbya ohadii]
MLPENVLDAYQQFAQACDGQASPRLIPNLRTALRVCILPQHGMLPSAPKQDLEDCLAQISLDKFVKDTEQFVSQPLDSEAWQKYLQGVSQGTIQNYRSVLSRFLRWINKYIIHPDKAENTIAIYAPEMPSGRSREKVQTKTNLIPYAVQEKELPDKLRQQLEQLQDFWINPCHPQRKEKALEELTFKTYKKLLLSYLGWLRNVQHSNLETVDLVALANSQQLEKFVTWGVDCRNNTYGWALQVAQAVVLIAKGNSQNLVAQTEDLMRDLRLKARHEQLTRKSEQIQTLEFEECVEILNYLRQCCASRNHSGDKRSELAILRSWQRYLMIALLTYCPIRQREIALLDLSESVSKQECGELALIVQRAARHQTKTLQYALPQQLSKDLQVWIDEWRPKVITEHNRIFIRLGSNRTPESLGQPLTDRDISETISVALRSATAALLGAPLEINAQAMHHSMSRHLSQIGFSSDKQPAEIL